MTLNKIDVSGYAASVTEQSGSGPDGYAQRLAAQYNMITVVSDGNQWFIVSKFWQF